MFKYLVTVDINFYNDYFFLCIWGHISKKWYFQNPIRTSTPLGKDFPSFQQPHRPLLTPQLAALPPDPPAWPLHLGKDLITPPVSPAPRRGSAARWGCILLFGWLFLNWNWNFESLPLSSVSLGYANVTGGKQQNLQDWNQATFTRILETQPSNLYTLLHEYFLRKESETWEQTSLSCHLS